MKDGLGAQIAGEKAWRRHESPYFSREFVIKKLHDVASAGIKLSVKTSATLGIAS
jgi:hypothetical protein